MYKGIAAGMLLIFAGVGSFAQAGTNRALLMTATSPSDPGNNAALSVDGNSNTRWVSGSDNQAYWSVDLRKQYYIDSIQIEWSTGIPSHCTFKGSNDPNFNANATDIIKDTGGVSNVDHTMWVFKLNNNIFQNTYQYIRFQGDTRLDQNQGYSFYEFRVFSDTNTFFYWDNSANKGYQAASGTWGADNFWSHHGTTLGAWPGAGNVAIFSNAADGGPWTITVNGAQSVDSIAFLNSGFTISGGTSLNFGSNSGISVASGKTATIGTKIISSAGLSKYGTGVLTLSGTNTYAGNTTIKAGTLKLGAATAIPSGTGNGNVFMNPATGTATLDLGGFSPTVNGLISSGAGLSMVDNTVGAGTYVLTVGGNDQPGDFGGIIKNTTGKVALIKIGAGILTLSGANSYTGSTTVNAGTVVVSNGYGSTSFSIASGAALELKADVTRELATTTFSGAGTLRKTGAGQIYWGATAATFALSPGSLIDVSTGAFIGGSNANEVWTNNYSDLTVASGATFGGAESNVRVNKLSGAGTITSGSAGAGYHNFTFGVDNGTGGDFSGVLANSDGATIGNFVKTGSGAQILSGSNTYTGTTTVSQGTLIVNGSLASASAVSVVGTLAGTGTVAGAVDAKGGTIVPGSNGVGTLRVGSLSLNSASVLNFELGTNSDSVIVAGNLILDGTLNVSSRTGFSIGTYAIIKYAALSADSGLAIGTFPTGYGGYISANNGVVTLTVVGPPSTLSYSLNPASYETGTAIAANTPTSSGGAVAAYSVSPVLPSGLTLDKVTGVITGVPAIAAALSGYVVTASNGAGSVTDSLFITVVDKVKAAFVLSPVSGKAPLVAAFSDSSKGTITNRVWRFGDGGVDTNTTANKSLSYSYSTVGIFNVKLTVSGPSGVDSMTKQVSVYNLGSNPVHISGSYLSPNKMQIRLTGYDTIPPPLPSVTADSVGLWYKEDSLPSAPGRATFLKWYSPGSLRLRGSEYVDTLLLPVLTGSNGIYGIMNGVLWSFKQTTEFLPENGVLVFMKDTMPIENSFNISGAYVPNDTARIYLETNLAIDTSRVDSVGLWRSLVTTTPDFTNKNFTTWMSAAAMAEKGIRDTFTIVNPAFNDAQDTVYASVICIGRNKRQSAVVSTTFLVGKDRPANPIRLKAKQLSSQKIRLSWNSLAGFGAERIIIRYGSSAPIPLAYDFSALKLDSLVPDINDTAITGSMFSEMKRYYFGAQLYKNGLWSYVTDSARTSDSTEEFGSALDSNTARIKAVTFDTATNRIQVCWTVNRVVADSLQLGILYSTGSLPAVSAGDQQVVMVKSDEDSAYVNLRENLVFGATYHLSLWLRMPGGKWTPPIAAGRDSVSVPMFKWQAVDYFSKERDTVYAFNNKLRFANAAGDLSMTQNFAYYFSPLSSELVHFVPVSVGFEFKKKDPGVQFNIGLKVDSLPAGYTLNDVRIYRKTTDGLWLLDSSLISADTARGYVSVFTNQIENPFIAMVDTQRPLKKIVSAFADVVQADVEIKDTIYLSDNIANLRWWFKTSKGGESFATGDTSQYGALSDTCDTIYVTMPRNLVSQDNGVRGILIVSDGLHYDTMSVSRQVKRTDSDLMWTEDQKWTPLTVTAMLDTPETKKVLGSIVSNGGDWHYDNLKFRLFRWYPNVANSSTETKWLEYADSVKQAFEFVRGSIIWIKTKTKTKILFGSGVTPSLDTSFSFVLPPKQWVDIAPPFRFEVAVKDIINSTRATMAAADANNADSLFLYVWKKDKTGQYVAVPRYSKAIADTGLNNPLQTLSPDSGYTVFNPTDDTVYLRIPPVPSAMTEGLAKNTVAEGWSVKVVSTLGDGVSLTPVYCGYAKGASSAVSYYPVSPSFSSASTGVFDKETKRVYGHAVSHSVLDKGTAYLLAFCNNSSGMQTITCRLENLGMLPKTVGAAIYDDVAGRFEDLSKGGLSVTVQGNSKSFRWLMVGPQEYLANPAAVARPAVLRLFGTYPNPFGSVVHIRYNLPYDGVKKVNFSIYDMRGKTVWRNEIITGMKYGASEVVWNGTSTVGRPVASGVYILRMTAFDENRKATSVFEKKMTFMP
jgi:autotransporter-associated beta strand protein